MHSVTFESPPETVSRVPLLHVAVYHSSEGFRVGIDKLGRKHMCCTKEMYDAKRCDVVGTLYRIGKDSGDTHDFHVFDVPLNSSVVPFHTKLNVERTGVYYFFLANCQGAVTRMTGQLAFVNPFGYLGVTEFPSLVFYSVATWFYLFSVRRPRALGNRGSLPS